MHIRKESTLHLFNPLRGTALAALGAAVALSLAHPAPTHAEGTYVHRTCTAGDDIADAAGGWQLFGSNPPSGVSSHSTCGETVAKRLQSDMFPAGSVAPGDGTGWTYTAPSGTAVQGITASFAGLNYLGALSGSARIQLVDSAGNVGVNFNGSIPSTSPRPITWFGMSARSLVWRLICDPAGVACTGSVGWAALYEPHLFLGDSTPPVGGFASGDLTTERTLIGNAHLSYSASDVGGGVARVRVYVDGVLSYINHVVDDDDGHCVASGTEDGSWVFSRPRPCPLTVTADETIDTTKIADGNHTITVKVVDAAQHESTLWTGERRIANHPPVNAQLPSFRDNAVYANPLVGAPLEALNDGTWSGPNLNISRAWAQCDAHGSLTSCAEIPGATGLSYTPTAADVGHRLRLLVTATNVADSVQVATPPTGIIAQPSSAGGLTPKPVQNDEPAAPAPAAKTAPLLPIATPPAATEHAMRGRVVGDTLCPQDKATLKFEHVSGGKLKLGYGKASSAQLQLTCTQSGKPIEAAQIDIVTRVGSGAAVASDVVTDGAGHATLRLAAGAGRAISVGYRMYADDPIARATATLKVNVNGRVRLRGNHRTLHNGRALTMRGRLLGGHVPKRGVTLTVQWKDRGRWRPFAQIKTNKKGTFSYAYRFTRTNRRIAYTLRVQISKGQLDYPFQPVASNAVKVTVAP